MKRSAAALQRDGTLAAIDALRICQRIYLRRVWKDTVLLGCSLLHVGRRGVRRWELSVLYGWNLYPTFQTVRMCRGAAASVSSLRRSSATCVSTVRLTTEALYPQTARNSSFRLMTRP